MWVSATPSVHFRLQTLKIPLVIECIRSYIRTRTASLYPAYESIYQFYLAIYSFGIYNDQDTALSSIIRSPLDPLPLN